MDDELMIHLEFKTSTEAFVYTLYKQKHQIIVEQVLMKKEVVQKCYGLWLFLFIL